MARRKTRSRRGRGVKKVESAIRTLWYDMPDGGVQGGFIDAARDLSMANRRSYDQGRIYGIESIEFEFKTDPEVVDTITAVAYTAGDSWFVQNAWVKGKALWDQMNRLVLEDNPSVQGKWADYKVKLDSEMATAFYPVLQPGQPFADYTITIGNQDWEYSTYVMPQHEVDAATGEPLPALELTAHLIGDDSVPVLVTGSSVSLVKAYAASRASVQRDAPEVPADMSESFFNLLTDSGSQEPELADVIEDENDQPPYDYLNYPQGDTLCPVPIGKEMAVASVYHPIGLMTPFVAECGLIKINMGATLAGAPVTLPEGITMKVTFMAGDYKGIASIPMGQ